MYVCLLFLLLAFPVYPESSISFDFSESEKILDGEQMGEYYCIETVIRKKTDNPSLFGASFSVNQFYAGNLRLPAAMTQLNSGFTFSGQRKNTLGVSAKADNGGEWGIGWVSDEGYGFFGEKKGDEYQAGSWFDGKDKLPDFSLAVSRFSPGSSLAKSCRSIPHSSLFHTACFHRFHLKDAVFDCQASISTGTFLLPGALVSSVWESEISSDLNCQLLVTAATPSYRVFNKGTNESVPLTLKGRFSKNNCSFLGGLETPLPADQRGGSFQYPVEISYRWENKPYYIKLTEKCIFSLHDFDTCGQIDTGVKRGKNSDCLTFLCRFQSEKGFTRLKAGLKEKLDPFEWEVSLDSDPLDDFVSDLFFSWGWRLPQFCFFMEWKRPLISFPEEAGPIDFSVNGMISF